MDKIIMSQMVNEERAFITQDINLYDKLDCLLALHVPFKITPVCLDEFLLLEGQIETRMFNEEDFPKANIYFDKEHDSLSIGVNGIKYDITRNGKVINTTEVFPFYEFDENSVNIYTVEKYDDILNHYGFDVKICGKKHVKSMKESN